MSKKTNWAEMDKRIRQRRAVWEPAERAEVEQELKKLPDQASQCDPVTVAQPALGGASGDKRSN